MATTQPDTTVESALATAAQAQPITLDTRFEGFHGYREPSPDRINLTGDADRASHSHAAPFRA